jgi:hypothetical protein
LDQSNAHRDNIIHHDKNDIDVVDESITKNDENQNEDVECSCPICLCTASELRIVSSHYPSTPSTSVATNSSTDTGTSDKGFVYSSTCGHIYCVPCIQQLLLYSSSVSLSNRTHTSTVHRLEDNEAAPIPSIITLTHGLCPLCRAELSYFDLKTIHIQKDTKSSNKKYKIIQTDETLVPKDDISTLPSELYGKKFQSDKTSTLIRFPMNMNDDTDIELRISSTNRTDDDQPWCIMKLQGYQYLSTTHTLKGWGKTSIENKSKEKFMIEYCVWMTFSDNFMFVTHGVGRFKIWNPFKELTSPQQKIDASLGGFYINVYGENSNNEMLRVINPITGTNANPDQKNNSVTTTPKRSIRFENSTYWGNIYYQNYKIGFASYHFITKPVIGNKKKGEVSDSNSTNGMEYISYEHVSTSSWLPLDNGRPIPSRVLFRNVQCPDEYTFCGSICWERDYNTTRQGSSRWDYIIKFDFEFKCIASGTVHCVNTNGKKLVELKSTFGDDLIYVNAGFYDSFTEHLVSKYGDCISELKECDTSFLILDIIMKSSISTCESVSDKLLIQDVTSETVNMILHILNAATYNVNNKLLQNFKSK